MKSFFVVGVLAAAPLLAWAECPNGCSGQGTCGQNDQCTCYQGHRGNACEQRVCPFGKAWTTTPNGDVNFDGDLYDAAVYDSLVLYTSRSHVKTVENMGGTWELWPSFAVDGEGHFPMECSNAGICNKELGQCECFEGFEGYACERMSCPGGNDCNGHGRCMTIAQQLDELYDETDGGTSRTYTLWDRDMARSCKCDPGYTGIDCMSRVCPRGDDPLTTTHQIDDTQFVRIWSTIATDDATGGRLGGTFTLTYKDLNGEAFTTDPIALVQQDGSTAATTTIQTAVENALEALPNGKVPDVEVKAGYCEQVLAGTFQADFASGATNGGTIPAASGFMRCLNAATAGADSCTNVVWDIAGAKVFDVGPDTACAAIDDTNVAIDGDTSGCTRLLFPRCMELRITFSDPANSGPQELLKVNHDSVTLNSLTNAASNNAAAITSEVTKEPIINYPAETPSLGYVKASSVTITDADTDSGDIGVTGPAAITFGGSQASVDELPAGALIDIYCKDVSAGATAFEFMGTYEVYATVTVAASGTVTLTKNFNDPQGKCQGADNFEIKLKTSYIKSTVDYATHLTDVPYALSLDANTIASKVKSIAPYTAGLSYILLEDEADATAAYGPAWSFKAAGAGTKEQATCSDRGNCDSETGMCSCYKGYTGERCDTQNALWVGDSE